MVSIPFLYLFSGWLFPVRGSSMDIFLFAQKLPSSGAAFACPECLSLFGNSQRQPKFGCEMVAKVAWQLATATSTPKGVCLWLPDAVAVLSNFRAWLVSVCIRPAGAGSRSADAWMKDILRNSGIYPLVANPVRARGRGCANAYGSRAYVRLAARRGRSCQSRRLGWSRSRRGSSPDARRRGRMRVESCDNLVTIEGAARRWRLFRGFTGGWVRVVYPLVPVRASDRAGWKVRGGRGRSVSVLRRRGMGE